MSDIQASELVTHINKQGEQMSKIINIVIAGLLFSSTSFALETEYLTEADYSRAAVKTIIATYLAGANQTSPEGIKTVIEEIVVNDQNGTQAYDVEVLFTKGEALVFSFEGLKITDIQ